MKFIQAFIGCVFLSSIAVCAASLETNWVVYEGSAGPGHGKHIVFLSGDDEYRSEEGLPMLAKILAVRQGFKCTVLFPINPQDGTIDPATQTNIPGMAALDSADVCVLGLRFRELPDAEMKHFVDFFKAGKSIIALRTSTHAFAYEQNKASPYVRYDWRSSDWPGGFGQQVLGETWVSHHGKHAVQSTRGVIAENAARNPLLRGVSDIWVPTDVYTVSHLPADADVLVRGEVLAGMKSNDPPLEGSKNSPMMPVAWTRQFVNDSGKTNKIFTTTMGAAVDLQNEGLRRLVINACFRGAGLQSEIKPDANVSYVGAYQPTWFGFGTHKKGVKPHDLELAP